VLQKHVLRVIPLGGSTLLMDVSTLLIILFSAPITVMTASLDSVVVEVYVVDRRLESTEEAKPEKYSAAN